MPVIRIDQEVYDFLKKEAEIRLMTFSTPNEVIRAILKLAPRKRNEGRTKRGRSSE